MPMKCEGKQSFESRGDADRAAHRTRTHGYGKTMSSYRCEVCSKFHVGHRGNNKPNGHFKKFRFKFRRK